MKTKWTNVIRLMTFWPGVTYDCAKVSKNTDKRTAYTFERVSHFSSDVHFSLTHSFPALDSYILHLFFCGFSLFLFSNRTYNYHFSRVSFKNRVVHGNDTNQMCETVKYYSTLIPVFFQSVRYYWFTGYEWNNSESNTNFQE